MLQSEKRETQTIELEPPGPEDGYAINQLIANCPPLDTNSVYCNLLQATHFADTSMCARKDGKLVGFVSGYLIPNRPDTLFIWQVAVDESARGMGLASKMLDKIITRQVCKNVNFLETTITDSNDSSWRLFDKLAKQLKAGTNTSTAFHKDKHFNGHHDSEQLLRVGPIS
ncbi:MAG TPA: diaminobutyrate acetyltransferase [Sunxiuqinia sp.]|nr:diaminobutyrate acetyltransferase [Sunxiuqinia sp.]